MSLRYYPSKRKNLSVIKRKRREEFAYSQMLAGVEKFKKHSNRIRGGGGIIINNDLKKKKFLKWLNIEGMLLICISSKEIILIWSKNKEFLLFLPKSCIEDEFKSER